MTRIEIEQQKTNVFKPKDVSRLHTATGSAAIGLDDVNSFQ